MKTICIDIDGTICEYQDWKGEESFGKILPGAQEYIYKLKADGWFIIIFSTRSDKSAIANFLTANEICYDSINENPHQPLNAVGGKPIADVYLDDRAITFRGNWSEAYNTIINFKPWENE